MKQSQHRAILDEFSFMARRLGFRMMVPRPDGSLFILVEPGRRLLWVPEARAGDIVVKGIPGGFSGDGIAPADLENTTLRLRESLERKELPLLTWRTNTDVPIELSRWLVDFHLSPFLQEEVSSWGEFRLQKVEELGVDSVAVTFQARDAVVVCEVRALRLVDALELSQWHVVNPLAWRVTSDTRLDVEGYRARPEYYLSYALVRTFAPGQVTRAFIQPPGGAAAGEAGGGKGCTIAAGDGSGKEARDTVAQGCSCALPPDPRQEVPIDRFFMPPDFNLLGAGDVFSTLNNAGPEFALLFVAPRACLKMPMSASFNATTYLWHRYASLPMQVSRAVAAVTTIDEIDLVMSMERQVVQVLDKSLEDPGVRILVVFSCCVADFVGLDVEGIVRERLGDSQMPLILWGASPWGLASVEAFWRQVFAIAPRPRSGFKPSGVNLVGFAPNDSRMTAELALDLESAGIRVNSTMVPSLEYDALNAFNNAELSVVPIDDSVRLELGSVLEETTSPPVLRVQRPFGLDGSLKFVRSVASTLGVAEAPGLLESAERHRAAWDEYKTLASGCTVAIPLDMRTAACITRPGVLYGIPVVDLIREMGFRVLIIVSYRREDGEDVRQVVREIRSLYPEGVDPGIVIETASGAEALLDRLAADDVSMVMSEFAPDTRVTEMGKFSFAPRQLEMGLAGALRSQRLLLRMARSSSVLRRFDAVARDAVGLPGEVV